MKKKTLSLDELKVKSFMVENVVLKQKDLKGGLKATAACTIDPCGTKSPYDCGFSFPYCEPDL